MSPFNSSTAESLPQRWRNTFCFAEVVPLLAIGIGFVGGPLVASFFSRVLTVVSCLPPFAKARAFSSPSETSAMTSKLTYNMDD